MAHIAIPIPSGKGKQEIEIDIKIDGIAHQIRYKVELFYWSECELPIVNRVECIRDILKEYDDEWVLYLIGDPNEKYIPITFVKKEDYAFQRKLTRGEI